MKFSLASAVVLAVMAIGAAARPADMPAPAEPAAPFESARAPADVAADEKPSIWKGVKAAGGDLVRAASAVTDETLDGALTVYTDVKSGKFGDVLPDVGQAVEDIAEETWDGAVTMKDTLRANVGSPSSRLRRRANELIEAYKSYKTASDEVDLAGKKYEDARDDLEDKFEDAADDVKHDLRRLNFDGALKKAIQATSNLGKDIEDSAKDILGARYLRR